MMLKMIKRSILSRSIAKRSQKVISISTNFIDIIRKFRVQSKMKIHILKLFSKLFLVMYQRTYLGLDLKGH